MRGCAGGGAAAVRLATGVPTYASVGRCNTPPPGPLPQGEGEFIHRVRTA